jgi:hypothetical protein
MRKIFSLAGIRMILARFLPGEGIHRREEK